MEHWTLCREQGGIEGSSVIENRWCKSCHAQIQNAGGNTTN